MPIPDYETLMLPLLVHTSDGEEHTARELTNALAQEFGLSKEELEVRLPSGTQRVFDNRAGWAKTYLKKAGMLIQPRRGVVIITDRGRELLNTKPDRISDDTLMQYDEFREFQRRDSSDSQEEPKRGTSLFQETPEELFESSYRTIRTTLAQELLQKVRESSPYFFERLVVELLVSMGYGGSLSDAGKAIGRSGDEGIDGIIKEDRLGLDVIYLQAKRWEAVVGRPEIQKFVGALSGQRARKGVFITTSTFSGEAREYASKIEQKVILIDGSELAQFMIDHDIGTSTVASYAIKRVDGDYFIED